MASETLTTPFTFDARTFSGPVAMPAGDKLRAAGAFQEKSAVWHPPGKAGPTGKRSQPRRLGIGVVDGATEKKGGKASGTVARKPGAERWAIATLKGFPSALGGDRARPARSFKKPAAVITMGNRLLQGGGGPAGTSCSLGASATQGWDTDHKNYHPKRSGPWRHRVAGTARV